MCSLGIEPTTFCATDAMLYHWATQEHITCVIKTKMYLFIFFIDFLNEYILCSIMCTDLDFWLLLTMQKEYWKSDEVYIHVINLIVLYVCVYIYIYIYIYRCSICMFTEAEFIWSNIQKIFKMFFSFFIFQNISFYSCDGKIWYIFFLFLWKEWHFFSRCYNEQKVQNNILK